MVLRNNPTDEQKTEFSRRQMYELSLQTAYAPDLNDNIMDQKQVHLVH